MLKGDTWEDLASAIDGRLAKLESKIGRFRLADDFMRNLKDTLARFEGFAKTGTDLDFHRGEVPIERHFHKPGYDNGQPNPYLFPLADKGPYYAIILAPGTLDTKGGPVFGPDGMVLDTHDKPIAGFYVAGNCSASLTGQAYWGAGGTLGPAVTFGYIAGENAAKSTAA